MDDYISLRLYTFAHPVSRIQNPCISASLSILPGGNIVDAVDKDTDQSHKQRLENWLSRVRQAKHTEAKRRARFGNSTLKTDDRLAVILDAKRGQFFIAVYEKPSHESRATSDVSWHKVLPDSLMTAEDFLSQFSDKPIALIGEGLVFYKDKFAHKNISVLDEKFWNPSAANIHKLGWQKAQLGEFADPLTLTPNYIRGPDAIVKQR